MGTQSSLCSSSEVTNEQEISNTIEFDGQKFIVPTKINFEKQATFIKIQTAAKSFCQTNRVNLFYYPLITRMIAYRHEKIFLAAWAKLSQDSREDFLEDLSMVQHDLMDSFYHHYFKKQHNKNSKKSLKNIQIINPKVSRAPEQRQKSLRIAQLGKGLLFKNKVAYVIMCAGYSSRFDKEDKFLCSINLYERTNILDLLFKRLKMNGANINEMQIILNCNENNIHLIQKYIQSKDYYGFSGKNIHFLVNFALPIFDEGGQYCFDRSIRLIKRSSGTANCAQQIFSNDYCTNLQQRGIQYIYFSGAENILENPCDPAFLGQLLIENKKVGVKCTKPHFYGQVLQRLYTQSGDFVKILQSSNFDLFSNGILDKLPVVMNSIVFQLQTLKKINNNYADNIELAQNYQIIKMNEAIFNFNENRENISECYNFQKDIRYLITCIKDPLLFKVKRQLEFAPIFSKHRDYSFSEAVGYYKPLLEKQLIQFSS